MSARPVGLVSLKINFSCFLEQCAKRKPLDRECGHAQSPLFVGGRSGTSQERERDRDYANSLAASAWMVLVDGPSPLRPAPQGADPETRRHSLLSTGPRCNTGVPAALLREEDRALRVNDRPED